MNRLILLTCLAACAAWADVSPPDTDGCLSLYNDAGCKKDDQSDGHCTPSSCSKLDYSHGTPPGTITYECLKCANGPVDAPPDAGPTTNTDQKQTACAAGGGSLLIALAALLTRRKK